MIKELGGIRKELNGNREEVKTLRGNIADLAVRCAKQNERMTEAVELSMKMLKWLQQTLPLTQSNVTPGSSSEVKQPIQSSPSVKRSQQSLKQLISPTVPMQVPAPPKPKSIVRKPVPEQTTQEEGELEQPAKKKVKVTRPGIPPQSGSRGSEPQK